MAKKPLVPKYAHLEYQVLHELEVSIPEYFLLDMVYRLSRNGWCNKKLDSIAFDMRMTRRGVIVMRDRLIARRLLKKGIGNRLATTEKVNSVYFLDEDELAKSALSSKKVHSVHPKSALSFPKNNKRVTENSEASESTSGYELAKATAARLRRKAA
jgi:hypothetical protein